MKTFTKFDNGIRYSVSIDYDGFNDTFHPERGMDFESEDEKLAYRKLFEDGLLDHYEIVAEKPCACCKNYELIDSIAGVIAESPEEAYQQFIEYYAEA